MRATRAAAVASSMLVALALVIAPSAWADSEQQDVPADTVAPEVSAMTTALLQAAKASGSPMQLTVATRAWAADNSSPKPTTFTRLRAYFDPSGSAMWWKIFPSGKVRQVGACDPQMGQADRFRYKCTFLYSTTDGAKKQVSTRDPYAGTFAWIDVHAYELATIRGHLAGDLIPPQDPGSSQTITKTVRGDVTTFTIVRDDRPYLRRQTLTFTFTPTSVTRTVTAINYTTAAGSIDPTTGQPSSTNATEHLAFTAVTSLAVTRPRPMTYPPSADPAPTTDNTLSVPETIPGW